MNINNHPLDMKGCICHFVKWQIHPFISKGGYVLFFIVYYCLLYNTTYCFQHQFIFFRVNNISNEYHNHSLDMKGCICHFVKWQIHPFISKGEYVLFVIVYYCLLYNTTYCFQHQFIFFRVNKISNEYQ